MRTQNSEFRTQNERNMGFKCRTREDWVISLASVDPSKSSNFTAVVMATTAPLGSGDPLDKIPANVGKSPVYQWELQN